MWRGAAKSVGQYGVTDRWASELNNNIHPSIYVEVFK